MAATEAMGAAAVAAVAAAPGVEDRALAVMVAPMAEAAAGVPSAASACQAQKAAPCLEW